MWAPLATILAAIFGAIGTWLVGKRKTSGSVKTSEASELWQANSEFRTMLIEEARSRTNENQLLRTEVKELRDEANDCHQAQAIMETRLASLERENVRLKRLVGESN